MNIFFALILLVGGLILLWKSAEFLVAGAVGIAERFGISPLIIGLTVVAMGTSAPEVAASIAAVLSKTGGGDIAIGNVFGSNIANLALIGGLIALIRPLKVQQRTLFQEMPAMLLTALLLWPLLHNMHISRPEALILLTVFLGLILFTIHRARRESRQAKLIADDVTVLKKSASTYLYKSFIFVIAGLAGLAIGAKMTVIGAVFIGKEQLGLSDAVIGLTIIAFGTSLPELVTCVVASIKKQDDISIGNLVGSNIFNTLLVTGGAGIVKPFDVTARFAGGTDYRIMVIVSIAFAAAALLGRRTIGRLAGVILLLGYSAYIIYLFIPNSS